MTDTSIRRADIRDLPEIQRLNQDLFQYEHDQQFTADTYNLHWPYDDAGVTFFTECLGAQNGRVAFIAEVDGRAVGYLAGSHKVQAFRLAQTPIGELDNMFVEAAHRHSGVGQRLFAEFRSWLRSNHADRVIVNAYAKNVSALKYYHDLGFTDSAITMDMPLID